MGIVSDDQLNELRSRLGPLIGVQFDVLKLPREILRGIEPSQVGSIAGALMDACIPKLESIVSPADKAKVSKLGLVKSSGIVKDREGYPDYDHDSGLRVELKLLYVNPVDVEMKSPSTPREPSARLTQKVTVRNVIPERDVLLIVAYQLQPDKVDPELFVPTIIDFTVLPVAKCIAARDERLTSKGGRWFGDYQTPAVLSRAGKLKLKSKQQPDQTSYGRKESEGKDYNEDTNFGKLARIPYEPLQAFIQKHGLPSSPDLDDAEAPTPPTIEAEIEQAAQAAQELAKESSE